MAKEIIYLYPSLPIGKHQELTMIIMMMMRMKQWRQSGLKFWESWIRVKFLFLNSIFPGKFPKNFDFFQAIPQNVSILQAKIGHLQQLLVKLFYFSSSHHFRTYFLYVIRYNISRPVHVPLRPHCPKSGGRDPPTGQTPRIDVLAMK